MVKTLEDHQRGWRFDVVTPNSTATHADDDARPAMRAFLQRGETRLSTYQRIAGAFLGGAGLLVLIPFLARESTLTMVTFILEVLETSRWQALLLVVSWLMMLGIPLAAFLSLMKDMIRLYFSPIFVVQDTRHITRFTVGGLTFPYDEAPRGKAAVMHEQHVTDRYVDFMLLGVSERALEQTYTQEASGASVIPNNPGGGATRRRLHWSVLNGDVPVVDWNPWEVQADDAANPDGSPSPEQQAPPAPAEAEARRTYARRVAAMYGMFSLSGSVDLALVQEVARMETTLARHAVMLRRIVLRYTKALLLVVWASLLLLVMSAILTRDYAPELVAAVDPTGQMAEGDRLSHTAAQADALRDERTARTATVLWISALWALTSIYIVRIPMMVIDELHRRVMQGRVEESPPPAPAADVALAHASTTPHALVRLGRRLNLLTRSHDDLDLTTFETWVVGACLVTLVLSGVSAWLLTWGWWLPGFLVQEWALLSLVRTSLGLAWLPHWWLFWGWIALCW